MGQKGFFDIAQRYAGLDAKNDPLARIDEVVPWEDFRPRLEAAWRKPTEERKSPAGRKPWDAVVMFKAIVLCELYNLSDDQVEYQLRDRLSFMRFLVGPVKFQLQAAVEIDPKSVPFRFTHRMCHLLCPLSPLSI